MIWQDHRTLEVLRVRAVEQVRAGAHPEDVALTLGLHREYPAIRAAARKQGATIYFADEAGIRSDYHSGTTWAPIGNTPVVRNTGARYSVNMLSAVTAQGSLRFMVHEGTVNAGVFIDFCQRLLADASGPVYLIVDGHPAHRARATTAFAASTDRRLRLIFLSATRPSSTPTSGSGRTSNTTGSARPGSPARTT